MDSSQALEFTYQVESYLNGDMPLGFRMMSNQAQLKSFTNLSNLVKDSFGNVSDLNRRSVAEFIVNIGYIPFS